MRLFNFPGGVKLSAHKHESTRLAVTPAKLPPHIILPLQQNIGNPAKPVVNIGDKVFKGQIIAKSEDGISVPVHASTSGKIVAIEKRPVPHPSGLLAPCIVIETDGFDQARRQSKRSVDFNKLRPNELRTIIKNAGIVGLGGAGFPSFVKLDRKDSVVETLIINGAECEPYISCDDMLMQEQSTSIVEGAIIMAHALQAVQCIIAIENNKHLAFERLQQAVVNSGRNDISVVIVPTVYPAGGEKQLIQVVTGKEVPRKGIPLDIGVVCQNVGTAYAVCRAVQHGEPLISRYVTITGGVAKARNLEVLIGTPMSDLIEECGGNLKTLSRVIMGGPMMGYALHHVEAPVIKTTNCILVNSVISDVPLPSRLDQSLPCIRCGLCVQVCPVGLLPHQLYWHAKAKEFDKVQDYHLFDCIECGCCDYVCPSHLPLVQYYRYAKSTIWNQDRAKTISDISRERHEFRQARIIRDKEERAARHKQKAANVAPQSDTDKKKAAIDAAMARVKSKQSADKATPKNIENLTAEQKALIAEADKRRAENKLENKTKSETN